MKAYVTFATGVLSVISLLAPRTARAVEGPASDAASVLFAQFETVAYARADFLSILDAPKSDYLGSESTLRFPFLGLVGGLRSLSPNASKDFFKEYSTVLVGAKNFVRPEGFGIVGSSKCYIGIIGLGAQPNIEADFQQATYESIAGKQVWTWSIHPATGDPSPSKFYAAQIGRSYFVMANNRQDFEDVVVALMTSQTSKPGTINIPEWATFSKYDYWAYRSFRRGEVRDIDAAGINYLPADVLSLAYFVDMGKQIGVVQVVSSDRSMKKSPTIALRSDLNKLQPNRVGTWQGTMSLSKSGVDDSVSQLFYLFGFGVAA